jgi:hypothetical protein
VLAARRIATGVLRSFMMIDFRIALAESLLRASNKDRSLKEGEHEKKQDYQ